MATLFSEIYERAASKIEDPTLALLPEEDLEGMFHEWLMSAIAQFRKCKNDLSNRDEENKQFNVDLLDIDKEILAILIVRQWLAPQLNSVLLTFQLSLISHSLTELMTLDERLKTEAQKLSRQYTYDSGSYWT